MSIASNVILVKRFISIGFLVNVIFLGQLPECFNILVPEVLDVRYIQCPSKCLGDKISATNLIEHRKPLLGGLEGVLSVEFPHSLHHVILGKGERGGFEVIGEAMNGEEGYLQYKQLKPDVVTMDITMPTMDGIESLTLIRHADENAKVVMITAAGQKEKMVEALKRGAEEFITKPFDDTEVLNTLNKVASK